MHIFDNPNVNFLKWRWHALALSVLVIGAGLATIIARGGLPLGVDFSGGTVLRLKFDKPTSESVVRAALPDSGNSVVQTYGAPGDNEILVRLPLMGDQTDADAQAAKVEAALKAANVGNFTIQSKEIVGPAIGADLRQKGIWATISSLAGILLYIWFRFRLTFAIGAIVATFHDVLVTIVFLTWFGYDFSLTIVIFDRVRENQRVAKRESLEETVNKSVNQTLSRTIITAGTTFLAVIALFLFGGDVLKGLAFTLLVGIVAGTYSTVFIASAIAIILSPKKVEAPAAARAKRA